MSRTHPYICEHGKTLDWGDFGPDSDNGLIGVEDCPICLPDGGDDTDAGGNGYDHD